MSSTAARRILLVAVACDAVLLVWLENTQRWGRLFLVLPLVLCAIAYGIMAEQHVAAENERIMREGPRWPYLDG